MDLVRNLIMHDTQPVWDVLIVGGGPAGLSAAIYLGRSRRRTLLIHSAHSMAKWEKDVQNYLGFPDGIDGQDLLERGFAQARRYQVEVVEDTIQSIQSTGAHFTLTGTTQPYHAKRVLLATGLTHLPPDLEGVRECLGHSLFSVKTAMRIACRDSVLSSLGTTPKRRSMRWPCCCLHPE